MRGLVEDGAPIHAVGVQMHIMSTFSEFEEFSDVLQRYADLGLDTYITEFDVQVPSADDYDVQGRVYEEVLRRCLAQPRCKGLQIWGLDDYYSWLPWFDPLPFDEALNVKPAYYGLQSALSTHVLNFEDSVDVDGLAIDGGALTGIATVGSAKLERANLTPAYQTFALRYASGGGNLPATVELRLDAANGPLLVSVQVEPGADPTRYGTLRGTLPPVSGIHDVHVNVDAPDGTLVLDWMILGQPSGPYVADAAVDADGGRGDDLGGAVDVGDGHEGVEPGTDDVGSDGGGGGIGALPMLLWLLAWRGRRAGRAVVRPA